MSKYKILLTKRVEKQLDKLNYKIANLLIDSISNLANNPRPIGCLKLATTNSYRIRVGNYRVIYDIYDEMLVVEVITLGHRREVYK